jgi:hypothetical protein
MVIVPVRVPVAVGVKVTLIVQLPSEAIDLQVPVVAKSPDATMLLMVTDLLVLSVMTRFWLALVIPTGVVANARLAGEAVTAGT